MVELKHKDNAGEGGEDIDNNSVHSEDCSSESSLSTIDYDADLTTDGNAIATVQVSDSASFGNIAVSNSTDIHFGNKTFYHGPVTIKQFVYASGKTRKEDVVESVADVTISRQELCVQNRELKTPANGNDDPHTLKGVSTESYLGVQKLVEHCSNRGRSRQKCVAAALTLGVVVMITIVTLLFIMPNTMNVHSPAIGAIKRPHEVILSGKLRLLDRNDWLAQPPANDDMDRLQHPLPYAIVSHTATANCSTQATCMYFVRNIQSLHMDGKRWDDIAYNFLIGGDGYVYVGRGWDVQGAHTYGYNVCSIGISFIGTYVSVHPSELMFLAMRQLIEEGVRLGKLRPDVKLVAHRQVSQTESPGQALYEDLVAMSNWTNKPVPCANVTSNVL